MSESDYIFTLIVIAPSGERWVLRQFNQLTARQFRRWMAQFPSSVTSLFSVLIDGHRADHLAVGTVDEWTIVIASNHHHHHHHHKLKTK